MSSLRHVAQKTIFHVVVVKSSGVRVRFGAYATEALALSVAAALARVGCPAFVEQGEEHGA